MNPNSSKLSPFSVRLSRNIQHFLTPVHVNANVLPAMAATANAFCAPKLKFKEYIEYLFADLPQTPASKPEIFKRVSSLTNNFTKIRKILEVSEEIAKENNIFY